MTLARRRGASNIPKLADDKGYDHLTGAVAPPGRQLRIQPGGGGNVAISDGGMLRSLYEGIEEIADMWPAGAKDFGFAASGIDGRVLPRLEPHVLPLALTDVTGVQLEDATPDNFESRRRNWYAELMRSPMRWTPVHHIIGHSDTDWHGTNNPRQQEQRDAWASLFWEPESLRSLMATYEGIYELDWSKIPDERIIHPVVWQLRRAEHRNPNGNHAKAWAVKVTRARTDLKFIRLIVDAVIRRDMADAKQHHVRLLEVEAKFNAAIRPFITFGDDLMADT